MGDTRDYVDAILVHAQNRSYSLWDFGHLLWRPLGWLSFRTLHPITSVGCGSDERCSVTALLIGLTWLAGLLAVFFSYAFARFNCKHDWAAVLATTVLIFSQSFLNFAHTGLSYISGLAFLFLGLVLSMEAGDRRHHQTLAAVAAGCAFAGAVLMWFLYVLAIPAAMLSSIFLLGDGRARRRVFLIAAVSFAGTAALAYALVIANLKISSMTDLRDWMSSSSHEISLRFTKLNIARMVFGFSRSWINMGNDGLLFKRFLLHDPFNPVSVTDLARLTLWKVGLFYGFLFALLLELLLSPKRTTVLPLLLLGTVPVLGFAILWQGGDMERYLPLYPMLVLSLACTVENSRQRLWPSLLLIFVAVTVASNSAAMARHHLNDEDEKAISRLVEIQPWLKPHSLLVIVSEQDELSSFLRNDLFHPLNKGKPFHVYYLLQHGSPQVLVWQERFASIALSTWNNGGDVWISKRAFHPRPEPSWNWAEGDDPRVSWADFHVFFSKLRTDDSMVGADGFNLVIHSRENDEILRHLAAAGEPK